MFVSKRGEIRALAIHFEYEQRCLHTNTFKTCKWAAS